MIDFIFLLIPFILLSIGFWTMRLGISPMPTSLSVLREVKKALPETVTGTVVDLGSGFGTTLLMLAKKYPGCQIIGYERSPLVYWISKAVTFFKKNITIYKCDFLKSPLPEAGLIFTYLYPAGMKKLEEKCQKELKQKTILISHTFSFERQKPTKVFHANDLYKTAIYLFEF